MDDSFKVIIAGGRDFNNYNLLVETCNHLLQNKSNITIISGKAKGADSLGEQYALEKGFNIIHKPADWDKHKKSAGYIRNEEMAKEGNALIAFWDGKSKGTKNMIALAKKYNLDVRIIRY